MMARILQSRRLEIVPTVAIAALVLLLGSSFAVAAVASYRGEVPAASGPGRKIELRLSSEGKMTWITDYRNNRPPVTEEGRWNAISVEEIEIIVERRDGKEVDPVKVRLLKQGDTLQTTAAAAAQFGSQGLLLKLAKAAPQIAGPATGGISPIGAWHWESLISAAETVAINQPERYRLELQAGGKAQVVADCNTGQGSYTSDGRNINIRMAKVTRATCPAGSFSGRYLKALEAAIGQRVRGKNLFLDLPADNGTLKFVRAN